MDDSEFGQLERVPLFPLPNVVLFPRAVLPLHIFEERYKAMTADILKSDGILAMALLKPGWEKNYYGRAAIEPVVCVGKILTYEKLPDGKYNFLLQGRLRAKVIREHESDLYRTADLAPLAESKTLEIDLDDLRSRLTMLFRSSRLAMLPVARQLGELIGGTVTTGDVADLAAFNLLDDLHLKQRILGQGNIRRRVEMVADALDELAEHVNPGLQGLPTNPSEN